MTKEITYFFILCFLIFLLCPKTHSQQQLKITKEDFSELKILQEESYNGNSLWGYIDGGADLFLEYGFENLLVQEVILNNCRFKIDFYKMKNEKSALGIFSVSTFNCSNETLPIDFFCISKYQVQFALKEYFISIANEVGDSTSLSLSKKMAENIISKIGKADFQFQNIYSSPQLLSYKNKIKFFNGILGLQNGLPDWEDYFESLNEYKLFVLKYSDNDHYTYLAQIEFNRETDMKKFLANIQNSKDGIYKVFIINPLELIFIETNVENPIYLDFLEIAKKYQQTSK